MSDKAWALICTGVGLLMFLGWGGLWLVLAESRAWRRLMQRYFEARVRKPLPTGDEREEAQSSLALPKDLQEMLADRDAEKQRQFE